MSESLVTVKNSLLYFFPPLSAFLPFFREHSLCTEPSLMYQPSQSYGKIFILKNPNHMHYVSIHRSPSTYKRVTSLRTQHKLKIPSVGNYLIHLTSRHHSLAQPTLNCSEHLHQPTVEQDHLTQSLFKMC